MCVFVYNVFTYFIEIKQCCFANVEYVSLV